MSSRNAAYLHRLLPSVYRVRDAERGEPLRALLEVISPELDRIEDDIAGLYDNWFIETCDEWVVPYIGDLLAALSDLASSGARVIVLRATKGREGLVCGARCPGVADQRPRSIDVRRSAAACGTRHKRITDAHNRHGRGRRVGWSLRVGHEL